MNRNDKQSLQPGTFFGRMLHNWPWKLLALALAVGLWAGLISQDVTLTRERVFTDVPVSANGADTLRRNNGLIVVEGLDDESLTVRMRVDVPQREYSNIVPSNFSPRIDLTRITEPGEQTLRVITTSSAAYGTVTDVSPETVTVTVDEYVTNYRVPVMAVTDGDVPDGFYATAITLEPSVAAVSGPASVVDSIYCICVDVDLSTLAPRAGKVTQARPFYFVDGEGNEVDAAMTEVTSAGIVLRSVVATQTLHPKREMDVNAAALTTGTPEHGYRVKSVTVSPQTVTVAGTEESLDGIEALFADTVVDVSGANTTFTEAVRIRKPSALEYLGTDTLNVTVEIEPIIISRTFSSAKLSTRGTSYGTKVAIGKKNVSAAVTGPQTLLEGLRSSDVTAWVDVSGLTEGMYVLPVKLSVEGAEADAFTFVATPATVSVVIREE